MRILGIDMGSREVKLVMMENGEITAKKKVSTMAFYKNHCKKAERLIVDTKSLDMGSFDIGISTGYGRNNTDLESFMQINEVKAHVYGALMQEEMDDFILLDVGGQDVKVAKVEKGIMTDLELNEKCAASCGRYLENMSNVLEIDLEEMGQHHKNPVGLNATCAIFTESELIGYIAEGKPITELSAGVNYALYKRIKPMLTRFLGTKLILGGGVAYNQALRVYLENDYDEVSVLEEPQFNGAIGCCQYGMMKYNKGISGESECLD